MFLAKYKEDYNKLTADEMMALDILVGSLKESNSKVELAKVA